MGEFVFIMAGMRKPPMCAPLFSPTTPSARDAGVGCVAAIEPVGVLMAGSVASASSHADGRLGGRRPSRP